MTLKNPQQQQQQQQQLLFTFFGCVPFLFQERTLEKARDLHVVWEGGLCQSIGNPQLFHNVVVSSPMPYPPFLPIYRHIGEMRTLDPLFGASLPSKNGGRS
jgi:hypothetical protein